MTTKTEIVRRGVNVFVVFTGITALVVYLLESGLTRELMSLLGAGVLFTGCWLGIQWWARKRDDERQANTKTAEHRG